MNKKFLPTTVPGKVDHVAEECLEVALCVMKMQRFGPHSRWPDEPGQETNAEALLREIGDLEGTIARLKPDLESLINGEIERKAAAVNAIRESGVGETL